MYGLFELAGWQFSLGVGIGAMVIATCFRLYYGWWPDFGSDGQDEENRKLPRL